MASSTNLNSATRLYLGNLSPSVDEYTLMQVCAKHGKIIKLDYLFHKTGPAKGKPRGYAFVEYSTKEEALRAMVAMHDKLLRGRNIVVTAASEQSPDDPRAGGSGAGKGRPRPGDASRPTAISLLKGQGVAGATTSRKIAALEAKLSALRKSKPVGEAEEPEASTSAAPPKDAENWLETLRPPGESADEEGDSGGKEEKETVETAEGEDQSKEEPLKEPTKVDTEGEDEPAPKRRKIVIDEKTANLPARPTFDAVTPPRKK